MQQNSTKIKACLDFAQNSRDAREGRLTTTMLADELINRFIFEENERKQATVVATSFVKRFCTKEEKGLMEPRIPFHYKLKFEHFK